jgi:hypothetical protein
MKGHSATPNESEDAPPLSYLLAEYVDLCFPNDVIDNREKERRDLRI